MRIPVSVSLQSLIGSASIPTSAAMQKRRLSLIAVLAILVGILISLIARLLVGLINLVTNISFFGTFSFAETSPAANHLGLWVIIIPAIGGVIVGLMALYGSRAIRGHGIPEAMEQVLTNNSKIRPAIAYLKPLSSAIAIGTGGPFGAEGPIIATGGALGSTLGQLLKISHRERKILLAAGATAGMSAIFGTPVAAIFLAVELLLFEFSAMAILPVALACITGAAGHHFLFGSTPVFEIATPLLQPSNKALFLYSMEGIFIGIAAVIVTKIVYQLEVVFEKIPVHWMWWPAIGGVAVGTIGFFFPNTLGVGYNNITSILSGSLSLNLVLLLGFFKFLSWSIALSSGTSGGTLAPLLTIGGAAGALAGLALTNFFPNAGISVSMAALVGMAAMFAGASRALITSILFALETTGQFNALLPLLAACTLAYFISMYLMENTIMTEKIARRGIRTPVNYQPDLLEHSLVGEIMHLPVQLIEETTTISAARAIVIKNDTGPLSYIVVANKSRKLTGLISASGLFSEHQDPEAQVAGLVKRSNVWVRESTTLREAVAVMLRNEVDLLPVIDADHKIKGLLNYKNVMSVFKSGISADGEKKIQISLKRQSLKLLVKSNRLKEKVWRRKQDL